MRYTLVRHPASTSSIAETIEVQIEWRARDRIWLRYHAEVLLGDLSLPEPVVHPERRDGLWRDTCFELFLREPGERRYYEFNFSTARHWAAYGFDDIRRGRNDLPMVHPPMVFLDLGESHCALEATVNLPAELAGAAFDAALSAVLREKAGGIAYWALAHPAGKPDFHDPASFAAELPLPRSL